MFALGDCAANTRIRVVQVDDENEPTMPCERVFRSNR